MRLNMTRLAMVALCAMVAGMVIAAEPQTQSQQPAMPEMGPPVEMKQLAHLVGTWDVVSKYNLSMDPSKENWVESKGTATFAYSCDGAVLECRMESEPMMPGIPGMKGLLLQAYDREKKQWQATWIDNLGGRISTYTGTHKEGETVVQGEDVMGGVTSLSRITTYNETPTAFDWKYESSFDGGKTWVMEGSAKYTKKA